MSYKKILLVLALVIGLSFVLFHAPHASALFDNAKQDACEGVGLGAGGCNNATSGKISNLITTVVNILSLVVGIGAVIMIMVGGFKYVTSGGDSSKTGSAKSTIVYALIGLVIVALAQVIVKFVVNAVTK